MMYLEQVRKKTSVAMHVFPAEGDSPQAGRDWSEHGKAGQQQDRLQFLKTATVFAQPYFEMNHGTSVVFLRLALL
jgi:hypothetical protein